MSFSIIPIEILTLVAKELDRKSLKQFTLVSTSCRAASRMLLWRKIHLNFTGPFDDNELVLWLKGNEEIQQGITNLRIQYLNHDVLSPYHLIIEAEDLPKLAVCFPNIISLSLHNSGYISGSLLFPDNPTFSRLTHLDFDTSCDIKFAHLEHILELSPHITSLKLTERSIGTQYQTIKNCPILKHLEINAVFQNHLFPRHQPLFPFASLRELESLAIDSLTTTEDFDAIFECCSSTLKSFTFRGFRTVSYETFHLITRLVVLESFDVTSMIDVPENFLNLIPSTLQSLTVCLQRAHLEHLRNTPRPSLHLSSIVLEEWEGWYDAAIDGDNFDLIPKTVKILKIDLGVFYDDIVELYVGIKKLRDSLMLEKLSVNMINQDRSETSFRRGQGRLISIFNDINISLEFREISSEFIDQQFEA